MSFLRVASAPLASIALYFSTSTVSGGSSAGGGSWLAAACRDCGFHPTATTSCAIPLGLQHFEGLSLVAFAVAWRILTYQKGRTALAVGGIFIAILLIFVELGFFIAVPQGGLLIYDHIRFDLLVTSNRYVYQTESGMFAPARLDPVRANPDVAQASAVYIGAAKWQDPQGDKQRA